MHIFKRTGLAALCLALAVAAGYAAFCLAVQPSNDRDWNLDQAVLPEISVDGEQVSIRNVRDFEYRSASDYTPRYYDRVFDLDSIATVDFMVEPFSTNPGAAHTLLTFGFDGGERVAVSVEIRKEKGESFSPLKGLLRQYELTYVVASERDVIGLRANHRKDQVYLYPIRASREQVRALFLDMLGRAQDLQREPEFYNTLTNTCTTNIVGHVNELVPGRVPFDHRILLPGYSDRYAYELGLVDTDLSFDEARAKFNVNERAASVAASGDFSATIRK